MYILPILNSNYFIEKCKPIQTPNSDKTKKKKKKRNKDEEEIKKKIDVVISFDHLIIFNNYIEK